MNEKMFELNDEPVRWSSCKSENEKTTSELMGKLGETVREFSIVKDATHVKTQTLFRKIADPSDRRIADLKDEVADLKDEVADLTEKRDKIISELFIKQAGIRQET